MPTNADLRTLVDAKDPEGRPSFVSLYADLSDPDHALHLDRRRREVEAALDGERLEAFKAGWERAYALYEDLKAKNGNRGIAAFASATTEFEQAFPLARPIPTRLIADASPYVRPLARFADDHETFALVLLDSEDAAVYLVTAGKGELVESESTQPNGRHRKGGMSQMRYQRHRQGVLNQFYDDVAEHLADVVKEEEVERVVVAGPGQAKGEFVERLPKTLQEKVAAVENADFEDGAKDDVLVQSFIDVAKRAARGEAAEDLAALREGLAKDDLALVGPVDVVRAARDGRVRILIVERDRTVAGRVCDEHSEFFLEGASCACGSKGRTVDLVNEAVAQALKSDAETEFLPKDEPFLSVVGGVGALLRY